MTFCYIIALLFKQNTAKALELPKMWKKLSLEGPGTSYNQKNVSRHNNSQNA